MSYLYMRPCTQSNANCAVLRSGIIAPAAVRFAAPPRDDRAVPQSCQSPPKAPSHPAGRRRLRAAGHAQRSFDRQCWRTESQLAGDRSGAERRRAGLPEDRARVANLFLEHPAAGECNIVATQARVYRKIMGLFADSIGQSKTASTRVGFAHAEGGNQHHANGSTGDSDLQTV